MNSLEKIQLLQQLLARVRRNAQASRIGATSLIMTEPSSALPADADLVEPVADEDWSDVDAVASGPVSAEAVADLDLELLEEDIIEITEEELEPEEPEAEIAEVAPPPTAAAAVFDATEIAIEEEELEELPVSSRRPKVAAASMDEALASAAQQMQLGEPEEVEVPIKTPPPESGRQVAGPSPAQLEAPSVPAIDESVGAEPARIEQQAAAEAGPTPEQLGQTVELEEAEGPELELAAPAEAPAAPALTDELEAALPASEAPSRYDEALVPPAEARQELERHRDKEGLPAAPEPAAPAPSPAIPPQPEVTRRPAVVAAAPVAAFTGAAPAFEPTTFLELLDASLGL
jgi:hypothetical protein